jgi:hypothetical protein
MSFVSFDGSDLVDFWTRPWSAPFRQACIWVTRLGAPLYGRKPDTDAPNWLRPFFLQRWVGQAIAAWLGTHPNVTAYRYGRKSEPCWKEASWSVYDRRDLRDQSEDGLLWLFGVGVECLQRVAQEPPALVGCAEWTGAALCASAQIVQIYAELKRRHKAMRARALLREALRQFVAWEPGNDAEEIA